MPFVRKAARITIYIYIYIYIVEREKAACLSTEAALESSLQLRAEKAAVLQARVDDLQHRPAAGVRACRMQKGKELNDFQRMPLEIEIL
jgi:hypothetical protein